MATVPPLAVPPPRRQSLSPAERRGYKLLRDNLVLAAPQGARKPIGALAKAIAEFEDDVEALDAALIAVIYKTLRPYYPPEVVVRLLDQVHLAARSTIHKWTQMPDAFAECVAGVHEMAHSKRKERVETALRDGYVRTGEIQERHVRLAQEEGQWHAVDVERFWEACNAAYDGKEATDRLVCTNDAVRTRHGVVCVPASCMERLKKPLLPRCLMCGGSVSHAGQLAHCRCASSRACSKCVKDGKLHDCQPVLTKCRAVAAQLSAPFIPAILADCIVMPLFTPTALSYQALGVLWPPQLTNGMIETILRHPRCVAEQRRRGGELATLINENAVDLIMEDEDARAAATSAVEAKEPTGRAQTQRAKRARRELRKQAAREEREAVEAAEAAKRAEAIKSIQEATRRRRVRNAANALCIELAVELDAATVSDTMETAVAARRRLAADRGRTSAAETEFRMRLRDSEARFNCRWLPELRRSIEYKLLEEAVRADVEAERRRHIAASKTARKALVNRSSDADRMLFVPEEKWAGYSAHRCALAVLVD